MVRDLPIVNGMVSCPKKAWTEMARDACVGEQARCGLGCGFGCLRGAAAIREKEAFEAELAQEDAIRDAVRQQHASYYARYGALPSQRKARTGRPRGRPRKNTPREPVPGGRAAAR